MHFSAVKDGKYLNENDRVRFDPAEGDKGLKAENIELIGKSDEAPAEEPQEEQSAEEPVEEEAPAEEEQPVEEETPAEEPAEEEKPTE